MEVEAYAGSGNVFADLGLPNPEERLAKAVLVICIKEAMDAQGLSQEQAAERTGIPRPALSGLLRGSTSGFSLERLFRALRALGEDIEIHLRPKPADRESGRLAVIQDPTEGAAWAGEPGPQVAVAGRP